MTKKIQLPEDFINYYQAILGDQSQAFFDSFDQQAISAFRINPLKKHLNVSVVLVNLKIQ
ncbi:hypothetical protein ACVRY7_09675 [Streptococcus ictaluri]|uniref:Ribosomal RNA small subunit methyltransferase F N-terminal domain-containing protein n=1 Tax=Streptococcus ictaluri 707-05 TaxID=764299 RepID=G5K2V0_9STRE|nr:hypothetical protein [Streptococcus ictaluri]EHI69346.1 hypothetical protein STRIC_1118 [Streptococcus ictaluri 707-05]